MSQSGKCPHFDEQARKCDLQRRIQNPNALQMYTMGGATPDKTDWRTTFCSTSNWSECAVYKNDQKEGLHR